MLWIAFELVSSSYWKQLMHIWASEAQVVNCFRTCIFVILKTTGIDANGTGPCCELLSNLYLRHIENNRYRKKNAGAHVVNCFRTCIFVILKTTNGGSLEHMVLLWIAFELVSSSYWKQRGFCNINFQRVVNCFRTCIFVILKTTLSDFDETSSRCELLSNLYLRHTENRRQQRADCCELLSNLYLRHIENNGLLSIWKTITLWIAFELVSSSYWKQPLHNNMLGIGCCELLSNLYLRHIENNNSGFPLSSYRVVNCFRTCIFVILKTTNQRFFRWVWELWIAFELVSSSYWKQLRFIAMDVGFSCELLSNLYLRHIENNLR